MNKLRLKLFSVLGYIFKKLFPKTCERLYKLDALRTQYYLTQRHLTLCSAYRRKMDTANLMEIKYQYNCLRFFWMDRL